MEDLDPQFEQERQRNEERHRERVIASVEHIIDTLGNPRQYGTVIVTYTGADWATGQGVFRADCHEHGTYSYMTASHEIQLMYLAHVVRRYACPEGSHEA